VRADEAAYVDAAEPAPLPAYPSADGASPSGRRVHVVKKGDTLFGLARQYYNGDLAQWQRIYDANRDKIRNKDTIKIGQELVIPD
jgi:nucleoid-associated protein YgaU